MVKGSKALNAVTEALSKSVAENIWAPTVIFILFPLRVGLLGFVGLVVFGD